MAEAVDQPGKLSRATVLAIVAMCLGIFVIANDFTALSVALPAIEADFDADVSTVQWVVNAYALVFGVLIVPGGRLADMFGRRRILFIGAAIFAGFSALGGLAPTMELLIGARALMGIGGAMMWPAILGLIYAVLPSGRAALAGALVIGVAGLGNAFGPLLGGALTEAASWRWILLLNLPIAALACAVTYRTVHLPSPSEEAAIDWLGTSTLSVSLISLLLALSAAPDDGWGSPQVIGLLVVSVLAMAVFFWRERRAGEGALVPPSVMGNRPFVMACLATLLMSSTFFAALVYLPQFLQKILDANALVAGAGLLPLMGVFALASFSQGMVLRRIGMKAVVTLGAVCMAVGPLLIVVLVGPGSGYGALVPGMVVLGVGVGLFYSTVTTAGVTALDPSRSSLAGGILYMFQIAGGAVGLGLTTTVFLLGTNAGLADGAAQLGVSITGAEQSAIRGVVAGTDSSAQVLAQYPGQVGDQLVEVVRDSFTSGLRWALLLDAVLAVGGVLVVLFGVGGGPRRLLRDIGEDPGTSPESTDA